MKDKKFEHELGDIFNTFEESMLSHMQYTKKGIGSDAFILKNGYIDLKYDVVKLFMQAVEQHQFLGNFDFDFEVFKDKQRAESPLLKSDDMQTRTSPKEYKDRD